MLRLYPSHLPNHLHRAAVGLRLTLALFVMVVIMLPLFLFNILTAIVFPNVLLGWGEPLFSKACYDSYYELMSVGGSSCLSVALSLSCGLRCEMRKSLGLAAGPSVPDGYHPCWSSAQL